MGGSRSLATFVVVALIVLSAFQAAGAIATSGSRSGRGWLILRTDALGKDVIHVTIFQEIPGRTQLGLGFRTATSNEILFLRVSPGQVTGAGVSPAGTSITVDTGQADIPQLDVRIGTSNFQTAVPAQILLWDAAATSTWDWSVTSNATWAEVASSNETIALDGSRGAGGVHAQASLFGAGASVSGATYPLTIKDKFRGIVGYQNSGAVVNSTFTLTTPDGEPRQCMCLPLDWGGPGNYTIGWKGPEVFEPGGESMLAFGVDAPAWVN